MHVIYNMSSSMVTASLDQKNSLSPLISTTKFTSLYDGIYFSLEYVKDAIGEYCLHLETITQLPLR